MARTKRLRPLGTADLLDETVELYKSNFLLFVGIAAAVNLPARLIYSMSVLTPKNWALSLLATILVLGLAPVETGALIYAAADRYLGQATSLRACYRRSLTKAVYWPVLGVGLLQDLLIWCSALVAAVPAMLIASAIVAICAVKSQFFTAIGIGMIIGVFASCPLWARFMVAGPAVVLEKQGSVSAIRRSWNLTSSGVWRSALVVVVAYALVYGGPIALGHLIRPLTGHRTYADVPLVYRAVQQGIGILISVVLGPLVAISQTLLYFDLRVRKEGFDLQMLANDMEKEGPALI